MKPIVLAAVVILSIIQLTGCFDSNRTSQGNVPDYELADTPQGNVPDYELADTPYTTLQAVWEPLIPSAEVQSKIESGQLSVTDIDFLEENGLGVRLADGNPWQEHRELAPGFDSALDGSRKSLVYFWLAADPQIIDEESPIRFDGFTELYRPHGHLIPQVFEAHVRSARRISDLGRKFDFALVAGDLTDGSQLNEFEWMLTILNGGVIDPDSGVDDDPVSGSGNDYNDPFRSSGLDVNWYCVLGNHDSLYNGGFGTVTDELRDASVGNAIYTHSIFTNGYRDGATVNGDVVLEGTTPADDRRLVLRAPEIVEILGTADGNPAGHGFSQSDMDQAKYYFSVMPVEGKPVRLISLYTVFTGEQALGVGHLGYMEREQFQWLQDELNAADQAHELVIVLSHHGPDDFSDISPVNANEITELLEENEGVVLHLTGHGHTNRQNHYPVGTDSQSYGYCELMTASTVDFPMQSRIIEIVDENNGFISVYVTNLGHNSSVDSLAHYARKLAAAKIAFPGIDMDGDVESFWQEDLLSQNLLIRIAIPDSLRENLDRYEWATAIESEETLLRLTGP